MPELFSQFETPIMYKYGVQTSNTFDGANRVIHVEGNVPEINLRHGKSIWDLNFKRLQLTVGLSRLGVARLKPSGPRRKAINSISVLKGHSYRGNDDFRVPF
jgi:hypothetical protein